MLKRLVGSIIRGVIPLILIVGSIYPPLGKLVWKWFYDLGATRFSEGVDTFDFLNYGYAPIDSQEERLELEERDEIHRLNIQLYHRVATAVPIRDKEVLEVGCGHGGGSSYIMRYLKPKRMVGIDLSDKSIRLCNKRLATEGLTFQEGVAEELPFGSNEFDVVLNVESSHAYPSMERFLSEVHRVLRPGGYFLFADLRPTRLIPGLQKALHESGMQVLKEEEISANVLKSRDEFTAQAKDLLRNRMVLFGIFTSAFLATKGSKMYKSLQDGRLKYLVCLLHKPG